MVEQRRSEEYLEKAVQTPRKAREDLPDIIKLLGSQNPDTRVNAAWAVGLVVHSCPETIPEILPRLIPYLKRSASERDAARVLAYIADHFREWTRVTLEETYSGQRDDIQPFLSQLENPDSDIGPDDVFVLELLSGGPSNGRRRRTRQEDQEWDPPLRPDDDLEAGTRSRVTPREQDASLLREIERTASNLGGFEREAKIVTARNASIYKTMASSGGNTRSVVLKVLCDTSPGSNFLGEWRKNVGYWRLVDDHDRIASLVDAGRRPQPWIAVECLEEGPLSHQREIPVQKRLAEARPLVDAVAYAHRHGVIHGRLHPANVLCTQPLESRVPIPKITDWGVSHVVATHTDASGSPRLAYRAPEQVHDETDGVVDQYTDSYQLAACLYRFLTDRPPFTGPPRAVRRAVVERAPPPPTSVQPKLPATLDDVLPKAMAKHKMNRYESVERFRAALGNV